MQAYIEGVSTRKVDDLLQALGLTGIDKSRVSRICRELDGPIAAFRNRPLEASYPYLWLDATYMKVRQNRRITHIFAGGECQRTTKDHDSSTIVLSPTRRTSTDVS